MPRLSEDGFHLLPKPQSIAHNAVIIANSFSSLRIETISPFILHLFYHSAIVFTKTNSEQQVAHSVESVECLKQGLKVLDTKWRASGRFSIFIGTYIPFRFCLLAIALLILDAGAYLDMLYARESWYN
jgi:hypothetical protein